MESTENEKKRRKKSSKADVAFTVFNSIFMVLFVIVKMKTE